MPPPKAPEEVRGVIDTASPESYLSRELAVNLGLVSTVYAGKFTDAMVWFADPFYAHQYGGYSSYFLDHSSHSRNQDLMWM